jgi:hypothetical protein
MERGTLAETWEVARIADIDKQPEHLLVKIYTDENNRISAIILENENGLESYGSRIDAR